MSKKFVSHLRMPIRENIFNKIIFEIFSAHSQNPLILIEFEIERMFHWSDFGHFRVVGNIRVF